MSKYNTAYTVGEKDVIDHYMDPMEYVFFKGRGSKLPFIVNSAGPLTIFALIWLFVDGSFIMSIIGAASMGNASFADGALLFFIPFFAIHLMPVWIWIGMMAKGAKKWENSSYAITDRQIIVKNNATGMAVQCYGYDKIKTVEVHKGFLDKMLGVADLKFYMIDGTHVDILDIKEAESLYPRVKQRVEETPCAREMHPHSSAGDSETHQCKDYAENFNPYAK